MGHNDKNYDHEGQNGMTDAKLLRPLLLARCSITLHHIRHHHIRPA
jgi:hypothetical protein